MKRKTRMKQVVVAALMLVGIVAMAAPAAALAPVAPEDFAPADTVAEEAQRVAEDPAAPVTEPNEGIAPPPGDFEPETTFLPVETTPPKIDAAQFGVGWPAALAVGVALLAVLAMALMWRRDELA